MAQMGIFSVENCVLFLERTGKPTFPINPGACITAKSKRNENNDSRRRRHSAYDFRDWPVGRRLVQRHLGLGDVLARRSSELFSFPEVPTIEGTGSLQ